MNVQKVVDGKVTDIVNELLNQNEPEDNFMFNSTQNKFKNSPTRNAD